MNQQALLAIGLKEAAALVIALFLMTLGGMGGLLKFFFTNKLSDIKESQNLAREAQLQAAKDLKETTEYLRGEIGGMKDRLAAVELDLAKNYVPRTAWERGMDRMFDEMGNIKGCPLVDQKGCKP